MPKEKTLLLIAFCFALAGVARAEDWSAWQRAYDRATRTRFIPVELWTGAHWDGTQEIHMAPAALEFGQRGDKSIKGPTTWNGIQVYERLNATISSSSPSATTGRASAASSTRAIRSSAAAAR